MRTAIALFGTRVSPRFDCTENFMLITVDRQKITQKYTEKIRERIPLGKIRRLAELKVEAIICGGIDENTRENLHFHKIKVWSDISGEAEDALFAFIKGELTSEPCPPESP